MWSPSLELAVALLGRQDVQHGHHVQSSLLPLDSDDMEMLASGPAESHSFAPMEPAIPNA